MRLTKDQLKQRGELTAKLRDNAMQLSAVIAAANEVINAKRDEVQVPEDFDEPDLEHADEAEGWPEEPEGS